MEKLTQHQLAGMFAAYMPCKITDKNGEGVHYNMVGISQYESMLQVEMPSGDSDWWNYDIFNLLIKPLNKIEKEHAEHVGKIMSNSTVVLNVKYEHDCLTGQVGNNGFVCHFTDFNQECIDYLRSKGYDCGYLHIPSLIDAGYAIDNTKPTNQ